MTIRSGVYFIRNVINNHRYIGASGTDIERRFREHKSKLRRNIHANPHLQRAWNKYGEENFIFEIVCWTERSMTLSFEQRFMDHLSPEYNINPRAKVAGRKHTRETRERMYLAHLKRAGREHEPVPTVSPLTIKGVPVFDS